MAIHRTIFKSLWILIFLSLLYQFSNGAPWVHKSKAKTRNVQRAPLYGMKSKQRVINDYFVLIDKKKARANNRDEAIGRLLEHLKTKVTKNTDYYDIKKIYTFGDLVILRIKIPDQLAYLLQEQSDVKVVETNQRQVIYL